METTIDACEEEASHKQLNLVFAVWYATYESYFDAGTLHYTDPSQHLSPGLTFILWVPYAPPSGPMIDYSSLFFRNSFDVLPFLPVV